MAGARWVQREWLDRKRRANLRVYAVWFNMMTSDSRAKWRPQLLHDDRVVHFWDEGKLVGQWFADRVPSMRPLLSADSTWNDGEVLWDAWLLYRADARWTEAPDGLVRWGRTIVASRENLRAELPILSAPGVAR